MARRILLLGRKGIVVDDAKSQIDDPGLEILGGTCIDDVRAAFADDGGGGGGGATGSIDHVFMGAGIDLELRLEIVREIFQRSSTTTVHLKDASSGPKGFLPFVKAVLEGLKENNL
ncbi:hypothetical protein LEL_01027 [Akanthomyces lecanii RCEF 1005]|uniref:Uncharacterized protein n=1 Tax=Akanthomyces lecanii RCEF 1005 TaxID=1081108 RepID=A0A162KES2_CORDF|nr:hypothetical protein LEL_01027 [Akanthomyces lecanii RCEF 1005]